MRLSFGPAGMGRRKLEWIGGLPHAPGLNRLNQAKSAFLMPVTLGQKANHGTLCFCMHDKGVSDREGPIILESRPCYGVGTTDECGTHSDRRTSLTSSTPEMRRFKKRALQIHYVHCILDRALGRRGTYIVWSGKIAQHAAACSASQVMLS